ncbi:MAG: response regulator [Chrysiogenales bacterium]|nr:MAG: response regulator [Chrysiogenales bacterium]
MDANGSKILIVDDEEVIRYSLQKKLSRIGYKVISMEKAEDVLYLLKNGEKVDLIITDIKLRKMDGIELLRRIHGLDEPIPVLIITGHGNVEDAIKALRYGASDFIRKPFDINDVASSVRVILNRKHEKKMAERFARYMLYDKGRYRIPVDETIINAISYNLTKDLAPSGLCNHTTAENISLALQEAISNAMYHGCLEVSSSIREELGIKGYNDEIERRKTDEKYRDRCVTITYELNREYVEYLIEDEGPGFDINSLPDPRDPENFFRNSGRGLLIIRIHMDEVDWNRTGSAMRLRKYRVERNGVH